ASSRSARRSSRLAAIRPPGRSIRASRPRARGHERRRGGMLAAPEDPPMRLAPLARLRLAAAAALLLALPAPADPRADPARADNGGRDDQRGAANLITPERIVEAAPSTEARRPEVGVDELGWGVARRLKR